MSKLFSKQPFVFLAVSLAIGIVFDSNIPEGAIFFFGLLTVFFFVFKPRNSHVYLAVLLSFGIGVFLGKTLKKERLTLNFDKKGCFSKLEIIHVGHTSNKLKLTGEVLVSENKQLLGNKIHVFTDYDKGFKIGDLILLRSKVSGFKKPTIPEQFDFEKYYTSKGIVGQSYLRSHEIFIYGHAISLQYYVESLRKYLRNNIDLLLADTEERAIIKALVVGDREDISSELKTRYVTAGIFHILAVSGLHVGIIYMLLLFLLRYVPTTTFKVLVLFSGLIFYAFLTGLSTSVIRATVMFLMFGVSEIKFKKRNSINILFASCFFILLFQPQFIYESGFQLSVSAVLGILLFFRPIESYFNSRWYLVRKIWSLASVSIAAQILTTPFILFYFHQFPTYFVFINVVVVLMVQFVLIGGSLAAGLGEFFGIGKVCASLAEGICYGINFLAKITSDLPYSRITGLYINEMQVFLLIAFVFCLYWFMEHRQRIFFYFGITFVLVFSIFTSLRFLTYEEQEYLAFHKVKNSLVIEQVYGRQSKLFFNHDKIDEVQLHLALGNYWAKRNISIFNYESFEDYICINGDLYSVNKNKSVDYILLENKWGFKMEDKHQKVVFSSFDTKSMFIK